MNICIFSTTQLPTLPTGGNGLGRVAYDLARGLSALGHEVELNAAPGSKAPEGVKLYICGDDAARANNQAAAYKRYTVAQGVPEVYIDLSHDHRLSQLLPDAPILNYIMDTACPYQPPNAAVGNAWQAQQFPAARIVPLGICVEEYPFVGTPDDYVLYAAKLHPHKGWDIAVDVARDANERLVMCGQDLTVFPLPSDVDYRGEIFDNGKFLALVSRARALLLPSRLDAGSRVALEAAACGVPTLTLTGTGTAAHVADGVSGYVCTDAEGMIAALRGIDAFDRAGAREWTAREHGYNDMVGSVELICYQLDAGERW